MNQSAARLALVLLFAAMPMAHAADAARQGEVASRGAEVMPFNLKATQHIFTKTGFGGIQTVVARNRGDREQVKLVRQHLHEIQGQFQRGDFAAPAQIHGMDMPGLAQLRAAPPGTIRIAYRNVAGGARLSYRTRNPEMVAALHEWFDAQLADHGPDAMAGHEHHHGAMHGN